MCTIQLQTATESTPVSPTKSPQTYPTPKQLNVWSKTLSSYSNAPLPLPTPVNAPKLNEYLLGYDENAYNYLVSGFSRRFFLGYGRIYPTLYLPDHASLEVHAKFVETRLKELQLGRIKGPYDFPLLSNFKSSPLSVAPKKEPNSYRLIHGLSFDPENTAINRLLFQLKTLQSV